MSSTNEDTDYAATSSEDEAVDTASERPGSPAVRPTRSREGTSEVNLTPEFRKLLECPACKQVGFPPIYLCEKGHSLCHRCHELLSICPKCSSPITSMRNEMAESIVAKFRFKCPYFKAGCRLFTDGGTLGKHLPSCDFRPISCEVSSGVGCGGQIPFQDYADHVIEDHDVTGLDTHQAVISMSTSVKLGQNNWTFPPHFLRIYDRTFLCYVHASYNILIAWVALCGHVHETKDYVSAVTIFDPNKRFLQAKWIGQVHSIRRTPKEVYNSGNCLALLPESFLLFTETEVQPNGKRVKKWKCHFEVTKLDYAEGQSGKPTDETKEAQQLEKASASKEEIFQDSAPPEEPTLMNNNPSNLNNPAINLTSSDLETRSSVLVALVADAQEQITPDLPLFQQQRSTDDLEPPGSTESDSDI